LPAGTCIVAGLGTSNRLNCANRASQSKLEQPVTWGLSSLCLQPVTGEASRAISDVRDHI
jgi:hypothetical protein